MLDACLSSADLFIYSKLEGNWVFSRGKSANAGKQTTNLEALSSQNRENVTVKSVISFKQHIKSYRYKAIL